MQKISLFYQNIFDQNAENIFKKEKVFDKKKKKEKVLVRRDLVGEIDGLWLKT